jgi:hypothetical protein
MVGHSNELPSHPIAYLKIGRAARPLPMEVSDAVLQTFGPDEWRGRSVLGNSQPRGWAPPNGWGDVRTNVTFQEVFLTSGTENPRQVPRPESGESTRFPIDT